MPERGPVGFGRRAEEGPDGTGRTMAVVPGATALDDALAATLLPVRPQRGHKGMFGKLLVLAGSLDYAGAALLVCRAAGRAGAGLVTLAVPESLQPLFAAKVVEATTMGLPEDDLEEVDPERALGRILDHDHDAIVVGPGLRPGLATTELISALLAVPEEPAPVPAVVDAEALRSLARSIYGGRASPGGRCSRPMSASSAGSGRRAGSIPTSTEISWPTMPPAPGLP